MSLHDSILLVFRYAELDELRLQVCYSFPLSVSHLCHDPPSTFCTVSLLNKKRRTRRRPVVGRSSECALHGGRLLPSSPMRVMIVVAIRCSLWSPGLAICACQSRIASPTFLPFPDRLSLFDFLLYLPLMLILAHSPVLMIWPSVCGDESGGKVVVVELEL